MDRERFIEELRLMDINISKEQMALLDRYYNLLIEENEKINLTSITDYREVLLKHFYDSLTISKTVKLYNQKLCDVGTGAGFPGIVLKIIYPNLKLVLVESMQKRCVFLQNVVNSLDLKDVVIINKRAEDYCRENEEYFDIITSRAVAKLNILLEISVKSLKIGGYYIALKGNIDDEVKNIDGCLNKLNLKIDDILRFELPINNNSRSIVKIVKIEKTPNIYPRKYGAIIRNPL